MMLEILLRMIGNGFLLEHSDGALSLSLLPDKSLSQYDLQALATPYGWVVIEIRKGVYALKEAGILANN
jgi:hypothetical protein